MQEIKKLNQKYVQGFRGWKDEAKDCGRPPRVIFVLFVKADMSLHQV